MDAQYSAYRAIVALFLMPFCTYMPKLYWHNCQPGFCQYLYGRSRRNQEYCMPAPPVCVEW